MKRGIITNKGLGIHISDGEVWMTTWELADLFYTTAGAIHAAIKRILKTNILKSHEVCSTSNWRMGTMPMCIISIWL